MNRRSIKCDCGRVLTIGDKMGVLVKNLDRSIYGGKLTHYCTLICPDCGSEYLGYLKAENNSYTLFDTEKVPKKKKVGSRSRRTE